MAVDAVSSALALSNNNSNTNNTNINNANLNDSSEMTTLTTTTTSTSNTSTLIKSPSFLYINDLILSNNPTTTTSETSYSFFTKRCNDLRLFENENLKNTSTLSTTTNGYYDHETRPHNSHHSHHNLTINKVGSYVELRLKRISVGKCFFGNRDEDDDLDESTNMEHTNHHTKEILKNRFCRGRKSAQQAISASSYSSLSRSSTRSRSSSSSSSSSSSFSSIFAGDSSFRKKKKSSNKKIKLCNTNFNEPEKQQTDTLNSISSTQFQHTTQKTLNQKSKMKSMKMIKKKSKNKKTTAPLTATTPAPATIIQTTTTPAITATNRTKHNKFSKLNEECLSKSYVVASSISNFSLANNYNNSNLNGSNKLKCLLVGDAHIGKSALMCLYLKRIFQTEYQPTIVDNCEVKVSLNGESYTLSLYDTAGQEDWETLRVMAYPDTDVILLCFSLVRPDSMENIKSKWMPELNKYLPDALIVLVGTQCDLRDNSLTTNETSRTRHITTKEGEELKQRINAYKYIECSALSQLNIKEVFDACIEAYVKANPPVQPSCFETLFRRFTKTLRRRFSLRQHSSTNNSSSTTSSTSNNKKNKKNSKFNENRKYLHEQ